MQKPFWVERTVFFHLGLHTAAVVLLALLLARLELTAGSVGLAALLLAAMAASTVYAAKRVIQSTYEQLLRCAAELSQYSASLMTVATNLKRYARELEERAVVMDERERALEREAGLLNQYAGKMDELVAAVEHASGKPVEKQRTG